MLNGAAAPDGAKNGERSLTAHRPTAEGRWPGVVDASSPSLRASQALHGPMTIARDPYDLAAGSPEPGPGRLHTTNPTFLKEVSTGEGS